MSGYHGHDDGDCHDGCPMEDNKAPVKRTIKFYAKTSDRFNCDITENGQDVNAETYDGYPPLFLGDGDSISLEIDLDTGQIQNWKVPSKEDLIYLIGDKDSIN